MVSEAATLCQLCHNQCDQIKIAKCLQKLPKNDLTRKMIDLTPLQKLPKNVRDLGLLIAAKGFKMIIQPTLKQLVKLFSVTSVTRFWNQEWPKKYLKLP